MSEPSPIRHGTAWGYKRHLAAGETACEACKDAHAEAHLRYMRRRGVKPKVPLQPCGTRAGYQRHFLVPMGRGGTHGDPAFSGVWQGTTTDDVAFAFEDVAVRLGVRWGLKPVAAALGLAPVVLDAGHPELYSDDEMRTYGLSDARVTYELSVLRRDPALLEARIEAFLTSESA